MYRYFVLLFLAHSLCFAVPPSSLIPLRVDILEGNKSTPNYIINPSCRKNTLNITKSGSGTVVSDAASTGLLDGKSECEINAAASGETFTWHADDMADGLVGNNCEVSFWYFGADSLYKASAVNTDGLESPEITLTNDGNYPKHARLYVPCGGTFDNNADAPDLVIEATDNAAGVLSVAKIQSGELTSIGQFSAISEWQSYTPTFTGFGTAASVNFRWAKQGPDLLIEGTFTTGTTTATEARISLPNNLTSASDYPTLQSVGYGANATVDQTFIPLMESSKTYLTFGKQNSGVAGIAKANGNAWGNTVVHSFSARVRIQGWSASQSAAVADQTDYGWTAYTPTFTGFGTATSIECQHSRSGEDLLLRCKWTNGTTTATEARVSLPNSLTSADTARIPSIQLTGPTITDGNLAGSFNALIEPSVGYVTFGYHDTSHNGLAKTNANSAFSTGGKVSFTARVPIAGWAANQRAPTLIGSVTSNSTSALRIESASITNAGTCSVASQSSTWITGVGDPGAGGCDMTITGAFSSAPLCVCSTAAQGYMCNVTASSTSTVTVYEYVHSGGASDQNFNIMCMGPR